MGFEIIAVVNIPNTNEFGGFDRGHPVVLLMTIILYISNRIAQHLLYVFT